MENIKLVLSQEELALLTLQGKLEIKKGDLIKRLNKNIKQAKGIIARIEEGRVIGRDLEILKISTETLINFYKEQKKNLKSEEDLIIVKK